MAACDAVDCLPPLCDEPALSPRPGVRPAPACLPLDPASLSSDEDTGDEVYEAHFAELRCVM